MEKEFYVEVGIWIDAEDEDEAEAEVRQALTLATPSYDILGVTEQIDA